MNAGEKLLKSYRGISEPVKASLFYTVCSVFQKLISIITIPVFTKCMTKDEYAMYTLFITWQSVMLVITSLSLNNAIFNKAMVDYSDDRDGVVSSFYGIIITLTLSVSILIATTVEIVCRISKLTPPILFLLMLDLLFCPALSIWMARERFEFKYKRVIAVSITVAIMNPLLGIIAVNIFIDKAFGRILSIVIIDFLIGIALYATAYKKKAVFFDRNYWGFALKNNIPMIPHYLSGILLNHADRIMISHLCEISYAAVYGVAYYAAMASLIVVTAINASLTPWLYQSLQKGEVESVRRVNTELALLVAFLIGVFVLLGPEAMYFLGGDEYAEAVDVFPSVACSVYFIFLYCRFADVEFFYGKSQYVLCASILCALLNIVLNWIFIPLYGFAAAGVTTLVSYIVDSFVHGCFVVHILGKRNACGLYNMKLILLISLGIVIIPIAMIWMYPHFFLRCILLAGSMFALFFFRKKIKRIFIQFR